MKEKRSLKRESRRWKSESSKDQLNNNNGKLLKDGKEICAVPLIDCVCPDQPIHQDDPEESVQMACTNHACSFASTPIHKECFKALEEEMYKRLKHLGHKTSNWTESQIRQNLWDRKGLTLIQKSLRCPCHAGISTRDDDAWARIQIAPKVVEKKRKPKKKDLPAIVTRTECESENVPPQYDEHEYDEVMGSAHRLEKIRLEVARAPARKSPAYRDYLSKFNPKEEEFPNLGLRNARRTISHCDASMQMVQPSYKDVVARGEELNVPAFNKAVGTKPYGGKYVPPSTPSLYLPLAFAQPNLNEDWFKHSWGEWKNDTSGDDDSAEESFHTADEADPWEVLHDSGRW